MANDDIIEVLPCSDVQCAAESDRSQPNSGTACSVYVGEPYCPREPVTFHRLNDWLHRLPLARKAISELLDSSYCRTTDDLFCDYQVGTQNKSSSLLDIQGRQGQVQSTASELLTDSYCQNAGALFCDYLVDDQNRSGRLLAVEDSDRNEPRVASENSLSAVDLIECESPNIGWEGALPISEPTSLKGDKLPCSLLGIEDNNDMKEPRVASGNSLSIVDLTESESPNTGREGALPISEPTSLKGDKLPCSLLDIEDNDMNEPRVASENFLSIVDLTKTDSPNTGREQASSCSELTWLKEEDSVALWVKWRGQWQAGIKCARVDRPLSTLNTEPTHEWKKYFVIFFPRTKNYYWADMLLVRPIDAYPWPIVHKTHQEGLELVRDLTAARRFMMQKLAVGVLNIVDQLHSNALIGTALDVMIWKEFAMEASCCNDYSDLARMLLKLQNSIVPRYMNADWLEYSSYAWTENCQNANSAESVELLKEELFDSILWNDVNNLCGELVQPTLGSKWKTWRLDVTKWFSTSPSFSSSKDMQQQQQTPDSADRVSLQIDGRRPKLDVPRADTHTSLQETKGTSHHSITLEAGPCLFNTEDTLSVFSTGDTEEENVIEVPVAADFTINPINNWNEVLVESIDSEILRRNGVESTPTDDEMAGTKITEPGSTKNKHCEAYVEAKGRHCVRLAKDGDKYCGVHSRYMASSLRKTEKPVPIETPICEGTTIAATRCKHHSVPGFQYCKKHWHLAETDDTSNSTQSLLKRKREEDCPGPSKGLICTDMVLVNVESPLQVHPVSYIQGGDCLIDHNAMEPLQCIISGKSERPVRIETPMCGATTLAGTRCKNHSAPGSQYCKKHWHLAETDDTSNSTQSTLKRKSTENSTGSSEGLNCNDMILANDESPLQLDSISSIDSDFFLENGHNAMEELPCLGSPLHGNEEPCFEAPMWFFLYCEKHLPNWLKRPRKGKSTVISKKVFTELLMDCCSWEQKVNLHKACGIFYRLFKGILRKPVSKEVQFQWTMAEASKDPSVEEFLKRLIISEKDRFKLVWGLNDDIDIPSLIEGPFLLGSTTNGSFDNEKIAVNCKICNAEFPDDQTLGNHWMDNHKREAHWMFRAYACALCLDSFTNKNLLENHVQGRHRVEIFEQCLLLQCIPCGSHFANMEQLWFHVLSAHTVEFKQPLEVPDPETLALLPWEASLENLEQGNSASASSSSDDSQDSGSSRKFKCRFCSLKFNLLPDLGRHHKATHMGHNQVRRKLAKRSVLKSAHRLRSGRLSSPTFKRGLADASSRIRRRAKANLKRRRIQETRSLVMRETTMQPNVTETTTNIGELAEYQSLAAAKILFSEIEKTNLRPDSLDILLIVRSACCKARLIASLEEKYRILPESIYLKAVKLCSEYRIQANWHQEVFICPRGCMAWNDQRALSPVASLSNVFLEPTSVNVSDPASDEFDYINAHHLESRCSQKETVLCNDISFGKESIPVIYVVDQETLNSNFRHGHAEQDINLFWPWNQSFTYVTKPRLDPSLALHSESLPMRCDCKFSTCCPETCEHVYLFNNDFEDAKDIFGKPMRGRFPYDENGRIILEEGYLVYECNDMCGCDKTCPNRILQNGIQVKLEVFRTEKKGWGVRAGEAISRGTFICEFIGEVLDEKEAHERRERYGKEHCSYFYDIDARSNDMSRMIEGQAQYSIDATRYGNVSRFINRSCSPNLVSYQVLAESMDCERSHMGLYASRDIALGEELTFDYQYKLVPGEGSPCLCGSSNCRGRLY